MIFRVLLFLTCSLLWTAPAAWAQACGSGNQVPDSDLCLAGTTMIGNGGVAVFKSKDKSLSVEPGDTIAGWRVTQVKTGAVTLQRGGVTRLLAMNRVSTAPRILSKRPSGPQMHDVSPVAAGNATSVGTVGPDGKRLSISTHLPPVQDY
jgi:hypothetical protein